MMPLLGAVRLEEIDGHISTLERKLGRNPESPGEPLLPHVLTTQRGSY